jgi:hypothetical protein
MVARLAWPDSDDEQAEGMPGWVEQDPEIRATSPLRLNVKAGVWQAGYSRMA